MPADAITLEIIANNFLAIAEEMGDGLVRAAYSTNIKEREDCSAALLDGTGQTIAQAEHIPIHLGSMLGLVHEISHRYSADEILPGDVFITNDPYSGGGTHLNDVTVATPFFCEGRLVAFASNIAHHSDVGGGRGKPRDIYGEGLRIPPIKILEGGQLQQALLDFFLLNWRLPSERKGDLNAQLASLNIGLARLEALGAKYGAATLLQATVQIASQAERQARAAIATIPSGRYEFADYVDDDGAGTEMIPIRVAITVSADSIRCDFAGSAPQVSGNINVVSSALAATVYYAVKAFLDPTLPANGGYFRAIEILARPSSVVNSSPPAAVGFRTDTCQRVVDVILGALTKADPARGIAACHSTVITMTFSGSEAHGAKPFIYPEVIGGGFGARPQSDGPDAVQVHITNTSNLPVEALEAEYPLLVERYEVLPNSGGGGRFRGGLGILRQYLVLADEVRFGSKGDRMTTAPWGVGGGLPGSRAILQLNPDSDDERLLPSKNFDLALKRGDRIRISTPGGGGWGLPRDRDRDAIREDVLTGKVTMDEAIRLYGQTSVIDL
jgi:N-methylhydantoinase B